MRTSVFFTFGILLLVANHMATPEAIKIVDSIQEGETVRYAYVGSELLGQLEEGELTEKRTEASYTVYLGKDEKDNNIYRTRSFSAPTFVRDGLTWHTVEYGTDTQQDFLAKTRLSIASRIANAIVPPTYAVTVYSHAGDGHIGAFQTDWVDTRDSLDGVVNDQTDCSPAPCLVVAAFDEFPPYGVIRGFIPFDTSSIPSGATVTAASVNLYATGVTNGDNDGNDFLTLVESSQVNYTSMATTDFNNIGTTEGIDSGQRKDLTSISTSAYLSFALNATGMGWIAKSGEASSCHSSTTGITCLAVLTGNDFLDHPPVPAAFNFVGFYPSEQTGTSQDPYLDITYTEPVFPTVEATQGSADDDGDTTLVVDLPTGITAGELLIVHVACDCWGGQTLSTPGGWTEILGTVVSDLRSYTYTKTASGSEGSTLNITVSGASALFSQVSMRISGWTGTPTAAETTGSLSALNPPNVTASWGSDNNLFIALGSAQNSTDSSFVITAAPTNYSSLVVGDTTITAAAGAAFRELTSASDNPGTMAYSGGSPNEWIGSTIVVQPGAVEEPAAAIALSRPPNNLGLVGYWPMDEGEGTDAGDFSGYGNHAAFGGGASSPAWTSGIRGRALVFDGSADYASMGNSAVLNPATSITVAMWIYPTAYLHSIPVGRNITAGSDSVYAFKWRNTGNPFWRIRDSGGSNHDLSLGVNPRLNQWHHVAVTYDGTTMISYLNGEQQGTPLTYSDTLIASTGNTEIGRGITSETFPGAVDDVRIYSRAISASEVAGLARGGAARLGASSVDLANGSSLAQGLVGHWTFDGKDTNWSSDTAGTVTDSSGAGNTGTLSNMNQKTSVDGGALSQALILDGTDDSIDLNSPAALDNISAITIAAWVKPTASSDGGIIYAKASDGGNAAVGPDFWFSNSSDNQLWYAQGFSGSGGAWTTDSTLPRGEWHHIAVTYNSSSAANNPTFYVDGVLVSNSEELTPTGTATSDSAEEAAIGVYGAVSNPQHYFDGLMDDIRIYNRELTVTEVKQLYNLGQVKIQQ